MSKDPLDNLYRRCVAALPPEHRGGESTKALWDALVATGGQRKPAVRALYAAGHTRAAVALQKVDQEPAYAGGARKVARRIVRGRAGFVGVKAMRHWARRGKRREEQ